MELEPYLFFDGDCEAALTFYKAVFGGDITITQRFEGSPMESKVPPAYKNKVMHSNFKSSSLKFMASDRRPGSPPIPDSRVALSLGTKNVHEAQRVFDRLAVGGKVEVPFSDAFWGGKFGMLTDKHGIDWMVSCGKS